MYAKTAQPLYYNLTKHGTPFVWTADCEQAFDSLKSKLLMAPILTYLDFTKDFVLESDTNKQGLGLYSLSSKTIPSFTLWLMQAVLCHPVKKIML